MVFTFFKLLRLETVSEDDRQSDRWIRVGQVALTIDKVSAFTALAGSLESNDLSEKDRGRRSECDQAVAKLVEEKIPSDGLPISVENASQEDVRIVEVIVQGILKEQEYDFQPKARKKLKEEVLSKKFLPPSLVS